MELRRSAGSLPEGWLDPSTFAKAMELSRANDVPLHPKYNLFWSDVPLIQLVELRKAVLEKGSWNDGELIIQSPGESKRTLESLGAFISSLAGILIALAVFVNEPRCSLWTRCSHDIVRVTIFLNPGTRVKSAVERPTACGLQLAVLTERLQHGREDRLLRFGAARRPCHSDRGVPAEWRNLVRRRGSSGFATVGTSRVGLFDSLGLSPFCPFPV